MRRSLLSMVERRFVDSLCCIVLERVSELADKDLKKDFGEPYNGICVSLWSSSRLLFLLVENVGSSNGAIEGIATAGYPNDCASSKQF